MYDEKNVYNISNKALIYNDDGKILVLKEDDGFWDLPGGRLEYGEDIGQALKRECLEEIGVEIEILDNRPSIIYQAQDNEGKWRLMVCFKVRLKNQNLKPSSENVENGYFGKEELTSLNLCNQTKPLIKFL